MACSLQLSKGVLAGLCLPYTRSDGSRRQRSRRRRTPEPVGRNRGGTAIKPQGAFDVSADEIASGRGSCGCQVRDGVYGHNPGAKIQKGSLKSQRQILEAELQRRNQQSSGWGVFVEAHIDEGLSGKNTNWHPLQLAPMGMLVLHRAVRDPRLL